MITFIPLAGSARSDVTTPVAYLLKVDDVSILLDCGSPDWHSDDFELPGTGAAHQREAYIDLLKT